MLECCEDRTVPTAVVTVAKITDAVEGGAHGLFRLTRTGDTGALLVLVTVGGTATSGDDFTPIDSFVGFATGASTADVEVEALTDGFVDPGETIVLTVTTSGMDDYTAGDPASATMTIADTTPVISVTAADTTEGGYAGGFIFTRFGGEQSEPLTFSYAVGGTATSGDDYTELSGTATFASNSSTVTVALTPVNDTAIESDETVIVTVSDTATYKAGASNEATAVIYDNDALTVSVQAGADAYEGGDSGGFRFTRTGDLSQSLTVNYTVSGSATAGVDYTALAGTVTFVSGSADVDVAVAAIADTNVEETEEVIVTLQAVSGYTLGDAEGLISIVDENSPAAVDDAIVVDAAALAFNPLENDTDPDVFDIDKLAVVSWTQPAHGTLTVSDGVFSYAYDAGYSGTDTFNYTVSDGRGGTASATVSLLVPPRVSLRTLRDASEGVTGTAGYVVGKFRLTREGDTSQPLTVLYHVGSESTASSGTDFTSLSGSVSFGAGQATADIDVTPAVDALAEGFETLCVALDPDSAYVLTNNSAEMTITDGLQVVSVETTSDGIKYGPDGNPINGLYTFRRTTADLSRLLDINVEIDASSTASEGVDFATFSRTVRFQAGVATAALTIQMIQNAVGGDQKVLALRIADQPSEYLPRATIPVAMRVDKELTITSVTWVADQSRLFGNPLSANPNAGGGKRIFAEKTSPTDRVRNLVGVRAELSAKVSNVTVFFRIYDVDDPSSNQPPVDDDTGDALDNKGSRKADGTFEPVDDSTTAAAKWTSSKDGIAELKSVWKVSTQPGNNYRAAASIHPNVNLGNGDVKPKQDDGEQARLLDSNGNPLPMTGAQTVMSEMLTVWRKLHVERDHMAAPPVGEPFGGPGIGFNDVNPGGPIADPSITYMTGKYEAAYIQVVDDLGALNKEKVTPWVHNIPADEYRTVGLRTRDVLSQGGFWVVQIVGAYEGDVNADGDRPHPVTGKFEFTLGIQKGESSTETQGPTLVFTETIRSYRAASDPLTTVGQDEAIWRTVLHESVHAFNLEHGKPLGDEGPLVGPADLLRNGEAPLVLGALSYSLTPGQLDWIRSTPAPF